MLRQNGGYEYPALTVQLVWHFTNHLTLAQGVARTDTAASEDGATERWVRVPCLNCLARLAIGFQIQPVKRFLPRLWWPLAL